MLPDKRGFNESPLILTTRPDSFASRSGYPLLADYLPEAEVIVKPRRDPAARMRRVCAGLARRVAFSRWYLGGSAALEWAGLKRLRGGQKRLVHFFWAELDLGYLDFYTSASNHALCGTFHNCDDTIAQVIRFPKRLRRFAAIILMSESQRPYMLDAGVPEDRIHFVPHGVDTHHFTPPRDKNAEGTFRVLSVGGYRRDFRCLKAVCASLAQLSSLEIVIVGPASTANEFAGLPNVRYKSGLSDEELLLEYRTASCFLLCVENSTANNALLEAMACGLPVVGSRVGGIPDYVGPKGGTMISPGDPEGMAEAVKTLYRNRELLAKMGTEARRRAEELDWARIAELTRSVYAGCLNTGSECDGSASKAEAVSL
jgi:glycosyltransferase involved in cell wall biosynthesis